MNSPMKLSALYRALAEREPHPAPFEDVSSIDWADADVGRRYLRYGRRSDQQTAEELAFLHRVLPMEEGTRVLDAMCGDGRMAIPLAATGCHVLGLDINDWVIEQATALARERELLEWVDFGTADLLTVEIPALQQHTHDLALLSYGMLSNFEHDDAVKLLEQIRRYLKPGGHVVVELHLGPQVIRELDGHQEWEMLEEGFLGTDNPALVFDEYMTDPDALTFVRRSFCLDLETAEVFEFCQSGQFYDQAGLSEVLKAAGFSLQRCYGDFDGEPFHDELSPNLIAIAEAV